MTVALDVVPDHARPWSELAAPTHPCVVDTTHATGAAFGFTNIPMAVLIDENGVLVRPAESASIERSPFLDMDVPEGLPENLTAIFRAVKEIPDDPDTYRPSLLASIHPGD